MWFVLVIAGAFVAVLGFKHPLSSFWLYLLALPFLWRTRLFVGSLVGISIQDALIALVATSIAASGMIRQQLRLRKTEIALLFLFVTMLLSVVFAWDRFLSLKRALRFAWYFLAIFSCLRVLNSKRRILKAISLLTVVGVIVATLGLVQYAAALKGHDIAYFGYPTEFNWRDWHRIPMTRATSVLGDSNHLASFLLVSLFPSLSVSLRSGVAQRERWKWGAAASLMIVALLTTGSRGGLLGLFAGALILLWDEARLSRKLGYSLAISGVVLLTLLLVPGIALRFTQLLEPDFYSGDRARRIYEYLAAWTMFRRAPLFGFGLGSFTELVAYFTPPHIDFSYGAHNMYLWALAEIGIVGFGALSAVLVVATRRLLLLRRKCARNTPQRAIVVGILASWIAVLTQAATLDVQLSHWFWTLLGIGLSLPTALRSALVSPSGRSAQ